MTTVRLDKEIEDKLELVSNLEHKTKSEIIKDALAEYFSRRAQTVDSFAVGEDLFGEYGSGESDRSVSYKQRLKDKLHEKHSH